MTECKLPLDAKSTVCRGKPNSQTVITETAFDMKAQYYHWIFAWSGVQSLVFLETQYFFVNDGRGIVQFLNMSYSQSEVNAKTCLALTKVTRLMPVVAIFLWLTFLLYQYANCRICEMILVSLWVIYADLAAVYFPRRRFFSAVPLRGKLCSAPPLFIWGSPNGRQFVSPGVSPLKHMRVEGGVQVVSADGDVQMKHKQQRCWTFITKTVVPLKKIAVCEGFVVAQLKLSHSVKQEILLSQRGR